MADDVLDVVKKAHSLDEYSLNTIDELERCATDPLYFIEKYVVIQHPIDGSVPFVPFPFQRNLIQAFSDHNKVIGMLGRQQGKTTCAGAFLLWKAMFTADCTILITANKLVQALEIMDRIRYSYENLPNWLRAGVEKYNEGTIKFDNGSKIVSRATSKDAGRGLSITLLYCLAGETTVTIRNKETGAIKVISLEDLYSELLTENDDGILVSFDK